MTPNNSTAALPLTLGQGRVRTPDSFLPTVLQARGGGQAVVNFMKPQISDSLFMESLGKGKANGGIDYITSTLGWTDANNQWHDTGVEVLYAEEKSGSNTLVMMHFVTVPRSVWDQMKHDDVPATVKLRLKARPDVEFGTLRDMVIDDPAYYRQHFGKRPASGARATEGTPPDDDNFIGTIETTFKYSQQPKWYVSMPVTIATGIIQFPAGKIAFRDFVKPLLKSAVGGLQKLWSKMRNCGTPEETWILLEEAGEATEVTEEVAQDVSVSISTTGAVCFGIAVALAAVQLIVSLIPHYSYHAVQIYNASNRYDLAWNDPDLHNGLVQMAPVLDEGSSSYERLVQGKRTSAPSPVVKPSVTYGSASFSFVSNSGYTGLGESFSCKLYSIDTAAPATTASDYDGKTPAGYGGWSFNIPLSGKNDLNSGFSTSPLTAGYFWDRPRKQSLSVEAVSQELGLKLTVTYDYLDGKHPNQQGQDEYYYQSIITLEDVTA